MDASYARRELWLENARCRHREDGVWGGMQSWLNGYLSDVERASTLGDLTAIMSRLCDQLGFGAFVFVMSPPARDGAPRYVATASRAWQEDYLRERCIEFDPVVARALRVKTPFTAGSIVRSHSGSVLPPGLGKVHDLMQDHGVQDCLVLPYHSGSMHQREPSSITSLQWTGPSAELDIVLDENRHRLHVLLDYWHQRIRVHTDPDFGNPFPDPAGTLTPREQDVLSFAAHGYTTPRIADHLKLSTETVDGYVRDAIRKLGAANRTQAVSIALNRGLITL